MDIHTDEHDLAKVLDSVAAELNEKSPAKDNTSSAPAPGSEPVVLPGSPVAPVADASSDEVAVPVSTAVAAPVADVSSLPTPSPSPTPLPSGLDAIKKDALIELRPLVDKLTVSPEEKFDTFLLLIRSTDDVDLIGPAHEAAKAITDETRRAEALLDIIKEIDYLSQNKKS